MKATHEARIIANGPWHPVSRFGRMLIVYHDVYRISFMWRSKAVQLRKRDSYLDMVNRLAVIKS